MDRNERLILTLISKQWLVFFMATVLLIFKYIPSEVWAFQASFIIGANVLQKMKGVSDAKPVKSVCD
jgi:hypothetical protein